MIGEGEAVTYNRRHSSEQIEALKAGVMAKELHDLKVRASYLKLHLTGVRVEPTGFGSRIAPEIDKEPCWIEHISRSETKDDKGNIKTMDNEMFMSKLILLQQVGRLKGWWKEGVARYIVYEEATRARATESASEPRR